MYESVKNSILPVLTPVLSQQQQDQATKHDRTEAKEANLPVSEGQNLREHAPPAAR